jgi:hypothetical protein
MHIDLNKGLRVSGRLKKRGIINVSITFGKVMTAKNTAAA